MKISRYCTIEDGVSGDISLNVSMRIFVWILFCSYLLVLPELFEINLTGIHVKLLDAVSFSVLFFLLTKPSRQTILMSSAVASYRRILYLFVLFMVISSLYGFAISGFSGGIAGAIKVVFQQVWPIIQVLLFFNLGLIFAQHLRFGENLFAGVVTCIALVDVVVNIGQLDIIQFLRPLAPQSMLFIFSYLLILGRLIGDRIEKQNNNSLLLFCMLVLNFIAIMLSVTRTALGAAVIGTALMLVQKFWSKKVRLKYIFSIIFFILVLVGISIQLGLAEAFIYRSFNLEDSERIMIWLDAWRMFTDKPLMGVGAGYYLNNSMIDNFDLLGGASVKNIDRDIIQIASAHNTFLNTLATTGIIGLLIYLTVLGKTLILIKNQLREVDWIKTFFYITFFLALFEESTFFPSNRYTPLLLIPFWFFLGSRLMLGSRPESIT